MYRLEQCFALERYRDDRHIGHRELRGRNPGRPTILVQQRKFHGYNFQRVRAINTNLELNCVPDRWKASSSVRSQSTHERTSQDIELFHRRLAWTCRTRSLGLALSLRRVE